MTLEELKQLKRGDEIFIRAKFVSVFDDGDDLFTHTNTNGEEEVVKAEEYTHPENVISYLSSTEKVIKNTETAPKYGPCRKFRKGDKVRIVPFKGRAPILFGSNIFGTGEVATVEEDEDVECNVLVNGLSYRQTFHICHLELVTPVEELEPYSIGKSDYNGFVNIEKKGKIIAMIPFGKELHEYKTEAEAKAAAEAECARLNAEHRKEQA